MSDNLNPSPDECRAAILKAARENPVVNNVMRAADYRGLSGEDRYALLAHRMIHQCDRYREALLKEIATRPSHIVLRAPEDKQNG